MLQAGRSCNAGGYRFGFQGQEADNKIGGLGQHTTAQFWEYDTWAVKRWNVDPVVKPWQSPFSTFSNNPIARIDPNGDDDYFDVSGHFIGSDSRKTRTIRILSVTREQAIKDKIVQNQVVNVLKTSPLDVTDFTIGTAAYSKWATSVLDNVYS